MEQLPELLSPVVDRKHRAVLHTSRQPGQVPVLSTRAPARSWRLDQRWTTRLARAGLLPLARMIQATDEDVVAEPAFGQGADPPVERSRRFPFDRSLLSCWVDRWRPETHTFHLPCGEMTISLQDVAMLTGLPIAGDPIGPAAAPPGWQEDLEARFAGVVELPEGGLLPVPATQKHGPKKLWLEQFRVERMVADPTEQQLARHLEAFLLWLFGCSKLRNSTPSGPLHISPSP
ncbi:hypothetical protein ACP4OV_002328 [Aristida adscensionis]